MALSNLFGWAKKEAAPTAACGTACGAADKQEKKPAACGSACGCGDDRGQRPKQGIGAGAAASKAGDPLKGRTDCWEPQPGAGDKPTEKPTACGTACGAGDKQ